MDNSTDLPNPPADLSDEVTSTLQQLSVHELREAIIYAQEILHTHDEPIEQIEPAAGEEIIELTEHTGYTEVVKRQPCGEGCDECPHGPYIYHVTRERHPNGEEKVRWNLIGRKRSDGS